MKPSIRYGYNLIEEALSIDVPYAVATMELPWDLVKERVSTPPTSVVLAGSMDLRNLETLAAAVPDVDLVVGVGGGSAHDLAKFLAMKQASRLIQIPTMLGGDASITPPVGIREHGRVRYVGRVPCEAVFVDYALLQQAPPDLVRIGACDCLSAETALWDWRFAVEAGHAAPDEAIHEQAVQELARVRQNRFEIRERTPQGIRVIIDGYQTFADLASRLGNDRPQEGSEHFLAYYVEYLSQRSYVHGQLLAVCLAAVSFLQSDPFESVIQTLADMGIDTDPEALGITPSLFIEALTGLREFVSTNDYYYSGAHVRDVSIAEAKKILASLRRASN